MLRGDAADRAADYSSRDSQLEDVARNARGRFQTIEEITQSFLRDAIQRGLYRPGERLHQDSIAALLGVSRMPVRSSLRQLEAEGLISIVPYKGAIVSVLTPEEIAEIYDLRILVETYLLERASAHLTAEALDELAALVDSVESTEPLTTERLDRRVAFYERLYGLAQAPQAFRLAQQLRAEVRRYLLLQRVDEERASHAKLLDFLRAGDTAGAKQWLADHLADVSNELQQLVAKQP